MIFASIPSIEIISLAVIVLSFIIIIIYFKRRTKQVRDSDLNRTNHTDMIGRLFAFNRDEIVRFFFLYSSILSSHLYPYPGIGFLGFND